MDANSGLLEEREIIILNGKEIMLDRELKQLYQIFLDNQFKLSHKTSKALEFEHINKKEIVYLQTTKRINIVLNPVTVKSIASLVSTDESHSTALRKFPKKKNKGKSEIHYGYSFKFKQSADLNSFLERLNLLLGE